MIVLLDYCDDNKKSNSFDHYPIDFVNWLTGWCLAQTLPIFQLYGGVKKILLLTYTPTRPLEIKHTCL